MAALPPSDSPTPAPGGERPIRVLVVDDSRMFRRAVTEALTGEAGILVVGQEADGRAALEFLRRGEADVVTLDVEMPELDGLATLKGIRELNASRAKERELGVIMLSAVTTAGAEATITALAGGAFDFITKPGVGESEAPATVLRRALIPRIRACAARLRRRPTLTPASPTVPATSPSGRAPAVVAKGLRSGPAQAVVIGVSTGGPKALLQMLPALTRKVDLPILIVQHMPPNFTASLATSLGRVCAHQVCEAVDGQPLAPRTTYIAPGGRHLVIRRTPDGKQTVCGINDQPAENGLRPAADLLFRAAATIWGGNVVALVLTGMGSDGTKGLAPLRRAGAHIIAQDEASSVVWGMPGSAVQAGLVDQVLALDAIPDAVARAIRG